MADEFEKEFLTQCYSEEAFQVIRDFPRIQRYALFVSSMSMVETAIVAMVRASKKIFELEEKFDELAPSVIARGIEYLEKYVGVGGSKHQHEMTVISNLVRVRNCITHADGDIRRRKPEEAKLIKLFIENLKNADIDRFEHISLHEGFVEKTAHVTHMMIHRIVESMKAKLKDKF